MGQRVVKICGWPDKDAVKHLLCLKGIGRVGHYSVEHFCSCCNLYQGHCYCCCTHGNHQDSDNDGLGDAKIMFDLYERLQISFRHHSDNTEMSCITHRYPYNSKFT